MPVENSKFSNFDDGGDLAIDDVVVGLRNGVNTRFSFQGVPDTYLPLAGGTMAGAIDMDGNLITGLPAPSNPTDAVNKDYVDDRTAAVGASGTIVRSNGTNWVASTSTFADTYAINTILYNGAANTVTGLPTANNGVLITSAGGVPSISSTLPAAVQSNITALGTIATGVWNGSVIGLAYGGTNKNITASAGAIVYSDADSFELSAVGSAGQLFQSNGTSAPTWTTPTYPSASGAVGKIIRSDGTNNVYSTSTFADTYAINSILYASAADTVTALAPANKAVLTSGATGVPVMTALATDGQVIIGSTAGAPAAATLTPGTGISIANAANSITISATGGGFGVATVAGTSQSAAVNTMYILLNAGQTTVTLPSTFSVGDTVILVGSTANVGGWILAASGGDTIMYNGTATSAGGTITSSALAGQTVEVVADVANTSWVIVDTVNTTLTTA